MLVLLAAAGFGAGTVLVKLVFRRHVTVGTLVTFRFLFSAGILWTLAAARRLLHAIPRRDLLRLFVLGLGLGGQALLLNQAILRLPAATASLLLYTYPAMVAVAAFLLGIERLRRVRVAALGLSLAGTILVLGAPRAGLALSGVTLALASAAALAVVVLAMARFGAGVHPFVSSAIMMSGGFAATTAWGMALGTLHLRVPLSGWILIAVLALACTALPFAAYIASISLLGPTRAAVGATFEPVVTVLVAAVVLGERLGPIQLLGGAVVLVAVALLPLTGGAGEAELRAHRTDAP
jgi:drug/metabolite transporter (DMT)-like permease